jgi:hypothetical protein
MCSLNISYNYLGSSNYVTVMVPQLEVRGSGKAKKLKCVLGHICLPGREISTHPAFMPFGKQDDRLESILQTLG